MIKSADIRHTLHGSPQTTTKYGKSAPIFGAVPILVVALYLYSGDCEAIEQYVLERVISIQLQKYKKT